MRKRDLQRICSELPYKPDIGKHETTEEVARGLALLSSLGKQAELQLQQLREKGYADAPLVWLESDQSLDRFHMRTSVIAPPWDLTRESYPEFGKLKLRAIGPRQDDERGVCVSTDIFLLGTGMAFNVKKGRVERFIVSDRVLDVKVRINSEKATTAWGRPAAPVEQYLSYWIGGGGQGRLMDERREVDLEMFRKCVAYAIIRQTSCGGLTSEMPQVKRARDIVGEWIKKDEVCEQWVTMIQDCCQTTLNMANEVAYAKDSMIKIMES
jgi:hypothetical protein